MLPYFCLLTPVPLYCHPTLSLSTVAQLFLAPVCRQVSCPSAGVPRRVDTICRYGVQSGQLSSSQMVCACARAWVLVVEISLHPHALPGFTSYLTSNACRHFSPPIILSLNTQASNPSASTSLVTGQGRGLCTGRCTAPLINFHPELPSQLSSAFKYARTGIVRPVLGLQPPASPKDGTHKPHRTL